MRKQRRDYHRNTLVAISKHPNPAIIPSMFAAGLFGYIAPDDFIELLEMMKFPNLLNQKFPEHAKVLIEYCNKRIDESPYPKSSLQYFSPSKQLDMVLEIFADPNLSDEYYCSNTLLGVFLLIRNINTDKSHCLAILNQLQEDGYLTNNDQELIKKKMEPQKMENGETYFALTFKGKIFISQRGYSQREEDKAQERVRLENAEKRLRKHDFWLRAGGIGAGIGAILILIWDVSKYCVDHKSLPTAFSEAYFYLVLFPCSFLLTWILIRKLP